MGPLVVLRSGDVPASIAARRGEYLAWFRDHVGGAWPHEWAEHDVRGDAPPPDPRGVAGFILTGSSHSVTERAPWMLRYEAYLRECVAVGAPVLGVCFGHQILAQALGGQVTKNPRGREMGTRVARRLGDDPLFAGLGEEFAVNTTHVDTVARLPEGARVLATTALEPHAAFALAERPRVRAVQFHPEIDGDAMREWVTLRRPLLEAEGLDADAMLTEATDTPAGVSVLRNFVTELVLRR